MKSHFQKVTRMTTLFLLVLFGPCLARSVSSFASHSSSLTLSCDFCFGFACFFFLFCLMSKMKVSIKMKTEKH